MASIDLNSDLGESFGVWQLGDDEAMLERRHERQRGLRVPRRRPVDAAAVCAEAVANQVSIGAQVSYPDLARLRPAVHRHRPARAARRRALPTRCARRLRPGRRGRGRLRQAARRAVPRDHRRLRPRPRPSSPRPPSTTRRWPCSAPRARACCGPPRPPGWNRSPRRSPTGPTCATAGSCPRSEPGAVVADPAEVAARAVRLAIEHEVVRRRRHGRHRSPARSLCVHGDTPGAVELARAVRDALDAAGVGAAPVHGVTPRLLPYGPRGVARRAAPSTTSSATPPPSARRADPDVAEVVPAARTVLVRLRRRRRPRRGRRRGWPRSSRGRRSPTEPATRRRDPGDLRRRRPRRRRRGLRADDRRGRRTATGRPTTACAFCGFAPGFAYLTGLDPALHLPRRATPRTRVPAGVVAIAAEYTRRVPVAVARRVAPARHAPTRRCGTPTATRRR